MKTFAIYCTDKPDTAKMRNDARDAHFAHIEKTLDNFCIAGPMLDENGGTVGSLLVVKAADAAAARRQLEADPYFDAEIWADIRITEFIPAAGDWIGGKIW
ncbi:MAG: hypothetical protein COA41_05195 [Sphingopyxis sp.]|nr:MAG: hypothetical protein COA41_05195 [Sphingopyxis sp.]